MTGGRSILVGGGARSGKSSFALAHARRLGTRRVLLATAEALDPEMQARIARHRADRGSDFRTIEEPVEVADALRAIDDADVVVIDCLTLWLSNLLLRGEAPERVLERAGELARTVTERPFTTILVTNEVGMGIVPENALARTFRDLAGAVHQRLAHAADEIHVAILGTVLRLRPGPVEPSAP